MPRDTPCNMCGRMTFATSVTCDRCGHSLHDSRRHTRAPHAPLRGWVFSVVALFVGLSAALLVGQIADIGYQHGLLAFAAVMLVVVKLGAWVVETLVTWNARGRSLRAKSAEEVLATDRRPPIVYLRRFDTDSLPDSFTVSAEESLASRLRKCGPPVAVGRPGERYPPLGFYRSYATDSTWRVLVSSWLSKARLVIVNTDSHGSAVAWELEQCVATVNPRHLLLLVSSDVGYAAFREQFSGLFPKPLPELTTRLPARSGEAMLGDLLPNWLWQRLMPDMPARVIRFRRWDLARAVVVDKERAFWPRVSGWSRWRARRRFDNLLGAAGLSPATSGWMLYLTLGFLIAQVVRAVLR